MNVEPVVLTGKYVRLEPLSVMHVPELTLVGRDPSIWRYMLYGEVTTEAKMEKWVRELLSRKAAGAAQPFAVIHLASGKVAGATRYLEIRPQHRGLEIGGTWYGVKYQHTAVNTECKYLLLRHAFEKLDAIRVQIKTDTRNQRSRQAIERLGAKFEGVLRNHLILPDGTYRHSAYYSILDEEWPVVKAHLEKLMERR